MRFKKLSASSFGRFKDWESPDLDRDIVVIYGRNESGKTTLFKLISTILYGWDPVTDNPYIPWDGSPGECEALLSAKFSGDSSDVYDINELKGDSREIRVIRKLRNRPEGWEFAGEKKNSLLNRPISQADPISRDIFNEVYMLSADELRLPDDKTWNKIQDELLRGQYKSILNPVGEVVKKLEEEAAVLWRSDRRGNSRDRQLAELQRDLKFRLKKAEENEERLYGLEEEIESLSKEIQSLENERLNIIKDLDRSERLYPVYLKIRKIDDLTKKGGDISSFDHIPEDPEKDIRDTEEIRNKNAEKCQKLLKQKEGIEQAVLSFTQYDRTMLTSRGEIEVLMKSYSQVESDKTMLYDMGEEIKRHRDRITYKSRDLLLGGWQEENHEILSKIDEADLRASIEAYKNTDYKYREEKLKSSALKTKGGSGMHAIFALVSIILLLLGAGGIILSKSTQMMLLSSLLSLSGLSILIIFIASRNNRKPSDYCEVLKNLEKLKKEREMHIDKVKASLKGLPIAEQRLDDPGESLLVDVNALRELLEKLDDVMKKRSSLLKRFNERSRTADAICEQCSINAGPNILSNISSLERCLKEAEEHYMGYKGALSRMDEIKEAIEQTEKESDKADTYLEYIQKSLENLDGADINEKIQSLKDRRKFMKTAQTLKDELEHDYPDLENIISRIKDMECMDSSWIFDDEKLSEAKVRKESIDGKLKELSENMGSLKEEFKGKQNSEKPDDIKGQIESIDIEVKSVKVKRDRLTLLKNIIIEADRNFREENQPDVLKRAGGYIDLITGGRYTRIYAGDDGRGLEVEGNYISGTLDVEKRNLSRGTRGQIYLSLRLALCDHLDSGGERFPLFLDEAMVDWDSGRLQNTVSLLQNISKQRQVFLFTCKESLLNLMEVYAQIIHL